MLPAGSHVKKQSATGSYLGKFWKGGRGEGEKKSLGAFLLKSTCNFYSLLPDSMRWTASSCTSSSHHDVLPKYTRPSNRGTNPLKPWRKYITSSLCCHCSLGYMWSQSHNVPNICVLLRRKEREHSEKKCRLTLSGISIIDRHLQLKKKTTSNK